MSEYIYPTLLQPQFVYPDVEPTIQQALDQQEAGFLALPAISELFIQRMGENALSPGNPFEEALGGNLYLRKKYLDQAVDAEMYLFKKEFDPILVSEGKLRFVVPQLSDILAKEMQFVTNNGLPFLSAEFSEERIGEILDAAGEVFGALVVNARLADRSFGDMSVVSSVGKEVTKAQEVLSSAAPRGVSGVLGDDKFMQTLQQLSPLIDAAIKVFIQVAIMIANVIQAALTGASVAVAVGVGISSIASTVSAAIAASSAATPGLAIITTAIQVIMIITMSIVAEMTKWKKYLKALRKQGGEIIAVFEQLVVSTKTEMESFKAGCDRSMLRFKLVMGEMMVRVLNGESVEGFLSKDCDGRLVLNFSVAEEYTKPGAAYALEKDESGEMTNAVVLGIAAGALMLAFR